MSAWKIWGFSAEFKLDPWAFLISPSLHVSWCLLLLKGRQFRDSTRPAARARRGFYDSWRGSRRLAMALDSIQPFVSDVAVRAGAG